MPQDIDHPGCIGVYDSGVGGVSVLRALRVALPHESFVYVADSGYAPYGDQPTDFVEARARTVAGFLTDRGVKAMVLACNTVSVVAARHLRSQHPLPIIAMEPAIKPAVTASRSGVVLVLGTTNTLRSESVGRLCERYASQARIVLSACPGLVECVERGEIDTPGLRSHLAEYLRPGLEAGADVIVLGCTHYAFLAAVIAELTGPAVSIIEPSAAIARQLARRLGEMQEPTAKLAAQRTIFYTSGDPGALRSFLTAVREPCEAIRALPPLA